MSKKPQKHRKTYWNQFAIISEILMFIVNIFALLKIFGII